MKPITVGIIATLVTPQGGELIFDLGKQQEYEVELQLEKGQNIILFKSNKWVTPKSLGMDADERELSYTIEPLLEDEFILE